MKNPLDNPTQNNQRYKYEKVNGLWVFTEIEPHDDKDSAKQQSKKIFGLSVDRFVELFFAGVLVIVNIALWIYTGDLAKQARDQSALNAHQLQVATVNTAAAIRSADAAKNSADATIVGIRPWIKITNVELRPSVGPIKTLMFHWPTDGREVPPTLQFKVTLNNIGHSVAENRQVIPELFFAPFKDNVWGHEIVREQERLCGTNRAHEPDSTASIIFPGESDEVYMGIGGIVHQEDIFSDSAGRKAAAAVLIVCVNYMGSGIHYQSQARFGIYENNSILLPINVDADAKSLKLIRDPSADRAH
jgi:hypothetical protein